MNKVILMARLTRDPELTQLPSGTELCTFGVASNRKIPGTDKEDTLFVDVKAFGKRAATLNQYFAKGKEILLEGHLQLESWEDASGQKRSRHTIVLDDFNFVGPKSA